MSNTILTPTQVTRKALMVLHQKLNFVGSITRDYDDSFAEKGAKIGNTLNIRVPNQYSVRTGPTLTTQDTTEQAVQLTVSTQKGVDVNFTSADLTLSLDDFNERIIEPAMAVLAANIEADALNMTKDVYQSIWNNGAATSYNQALSGRVLLQRALAPGNDRTTLLNSQDMADIVKDTKTLFQDSTSIAKQFKEGYMGRAAGFDFEESTIIPAYTRGNSNGAYVVNGATQTGANLVVSTGANAPLQGDVFTIAGVFSVHPETKASTNVLQQFVINTGTSTTTNFTISPSIVTTGALQNVSASPANGAAVTFLGTANTTVGTSLQYQKGAFAFATADLIMPKGIDFAAREVMDGISMRIVRQYDIVNDKFPCRLDILYGYKTLRAQLATRLHNN
jgi:hypothetical protein